MRRRTFLATLPATLATAGCLSSADGTGPPDSTTTTSATGTASTPGTDASESRSSTGTPTAPGTPTTTEPPGPTVTEGAADAPTLSMGETFATDDGRKVTLAQPAVRPLSLGHEDVSSTHTYIRVLAAPEGEQFALATVVRSGFDDGGLVELPLAVECDGQRYRQTRTRLGDDTGAARGQLGVPVPIQEVTEAAFVWEREDGASPRWRVPPTLLHHFAAAPDFEVRSVSVPDSVTYEEDFDVSFTVANTGGRDGRFFASVDVRQGSLGLEDYALPVPTGGTASKTVTVSPYWSEHTESLQFVFDWGRDRRTTEIAVEGIPSGDGETATKTPQA